MELRALDLADPALAAEALELQRRAYRIEADLAGDDRIPPLHETLEGLQRCGETFLGAFVDRRLAGFVSWKRDGDLLDLHRLAVDPAHGRRGIGRALVRAAQASEPHAAEIVVQTGAANAPAKALYLGEGFAEAGEREVEPGLRVVLLRKQRAR